MHDRAQEVADGVRHYPGHPQDPAILQRAHSREKESTLLSVGGQPVEIFQEEILAGGSATAENLEQDSAHHTEVY